MSQLSLERAGLWHQDHSFGQLRRKPGESRTWFVIALTSVMMVVEIASGLIFGSMALMADGLHMASHTVALGINAFAYLYARRHAQDEQFSFGAGKVNTLGGYTGAVLLAGFSLLMGVESVMRLLSPVAIEFNQAIAVAVAGLVVNGISAFVLRHQDHHHDEESGERAHEHDHDHDHEHHHIHEHHAHHYRGSHADHNLMAAYLHVLADALTSLLAIVALLIGKYWGAYWLDPVMGLVGAVLVAQWSWGLLRTTSAVLLDKETSLALKHKLVSLLEANDHTRVLCLHYWALGPGIHALSLSLASTQPHAPDYYKSIVSEHLRIDHVTVEVHAVN